MEAARVWELVVNGALRSVLVPVRYRGIALRRLGVEVGDNVRVRSHVWIDTKQLTLGYGVFINHDVRISNAEHVTLGDHVAIAPRVLITTEAHDTANPERRQGLTVPSPVVVGDGTWIGAGAIILPGVTIGAGCVIAAGAVVTTDCEPHGVYAGVPAQRKKDLPTQLARSTTSSVSAP